MQNTSNTHVLKTRPIHTTEYSTKYNTIQHNTRTIHVFSGIRKNTSRYMADIRTPYYERILTSWVRKIHVQYRVEYISNTITIHCIPKHSQYRSNTPPIPSQYASDTQLDTLLSKSVANTFTIRPNTCQIRQEYAVLLRIPPLTCPAAPAQGCAPPPRHSSQPGEPSCV